MSAALVLSSACASGSRWPTVEPVGQTAFLQGGVPVRSVDVLPIDVQLWTHKGHAIGAPEVAEGFDQATVGLVSGLLAQRGYQVSALIGWDGLYASPRDGLVPAMAADEVADTVYALSSFGEAQSKNTARLDPFLPHRLGTRTRADATLYVGGWGYAGKDKRKSSAGKIAKGVAIGVIIVAVIAIAVVTLGKGGKLGDGLGKVAGGAGKVASGAARVAGRAVGGVTRGMGKATASFVRGSAHSARVGVDILDCFGRGATHIDIAPARPDYYAQSSPKRGRSQMLIEMTLIDNHTGEALWHARQRFRASPERPEQVSRALRTMLATLP